MENRSYSRFDDDDKIKYTYSHTHHIQTIIGSDNGFSPGRRQAII